ncbi:MAG: shikimate dehydrogenase [Candidatus Micrarchaeota archaeon]
MIAIPIISRTSEEALKEIALASQLADILELRLDRINSPHVSALIHACKKPSIATNRRADEGGKYKGSERARLSVLKDAVSAGADYVDLEMSSSAEAIHMLQALLKENKSKTKLILSYHNFEKTDASEIENAYECMKRLACDIIKIVTYAQKLEDNLAIFNLLKRAKLENQKIIAFCMGEKGEISRVLAPAFGSFLTFGSLERGKESAPGQIPAELLRNVYRVNELNEKTKIYGLIGNPVNKSKGYLIHNAAFKKLKLNAVYMNFLVEDVDSFFTHFKGFFSGLSVTMPHKEAAVRHLDKVDETARAINAVNTIVVKDNKLMGYNTDITGALQPLEKRTTLKGKNVVLLGAGGVSKAIAYAVSKQGARLTILNRTVEKAEKLARSLNRRFGAPEELYSLSPKPEILINATSIGMFPLVNESPVEASFLKNMLVFDSVYNPRETKLLREAKANGCEIISGEELFLAQAAEQFKLFTGKPAPLEEMKKVLG